jgi:4'-phosphopantetheinyl transferase
VLAELLAADPARLVFQYGADGKPALAAPFDHCGLHFNVSHSGPLLLVAVAAGAFVGVDLEQHRPLNDRDGLVRRYFSESENRAYFELPEVQRQEAFFAAWARKEALVKALGRGLRFPLRDFDVSLQPSRAEGQLLRLREDGVDRHFPDTGWWLGASDIFSGFGSALALPCRECRLVPL